MPVTKTAKRALRSSKRKEATNRKVKTLLEIALRVAKRSKGEKDIQKAISLADKAAKNNIIHRNKAARIKSFLSKLLSKRVVKEVSKKTSKTKKKK